VSASAIPRATAECGLGQDRAITDRAVDVYVLRLRQKIEPDPATPVLIHSVPRDSRGITTRVVQAAIPKSPAPFTAPLWACEKIELLLLRLQNALE